MKFKGDIIILDPCSAVKSDEDWQKSRWGSDMAAVGITEFLYLDCGADSCGVVKTESGEILGRFCTDSCALIFVDLAELLRYKPDFRDHERYPDSCTVIRGFDGEVTVEDDCFVGRGNINFVTVSA